MWDQGSSSTEESLMEKMNSFKYNRDKRTQRKKRSREEELGSQGIRKRPGSGSEQREH